MSGTGRAWKASRFMQLVNSLSPLSSQTFVAVDLETTGLNTSADEVIEVAIVRFNQAEILDSWSTLVRPTRAIGPEIQQLTGISPDDVRNAPRFHEVEGIVREKIGTHPIVGHNISFDVAMLEAAGIRLANRPIDTFRLSALFLYSLPAYSLSQVADALGVEMVDVHRAMADAEASRQVFLLLIPIMQRYSSSTLRHAARYALGAGWPESWLMQLLSEDEASSPIFRGANDPAWLEPSETRFLSRLSRPEPLRKTGVTTPVNADHVMKAMTPGGALGSVLDAFEKRPGQIDMANAVTDALNRDQHLMIEAGTGTGKSMAYLLPAALHAINRGERVVVSTDTRALQEQLYQKDVPDVQTAVDRLGIPEPVRAAVLKGRSNYICLRRWFSQDRREASDPGESSMRAKVTLWLDETESGDQSELRLDPSERAHWRHIGADEDACVANQCQFNLRNQCFLYRARRKAENAHIIVANHSLLLADTAHKVLPDFDRLIVDEAHHLEDEATTHFGYILDQRVVEGIVEALVTSRRGGSSGALDHADQFLSTSPESVARKVAPEARERIQSSLASRARLLDLNSELFVRVDRMLRDQRARGTYGTSVRVTGAVRGRQDWLDIEQLWEQLDRGIYELEVLVQWLVQQLERLPETHEQPDNPASLVREELWLELVSRGRELQEFRQRLSAVVVEPQDDTIYWIEQQGSKRNPAVRAAPLYVDELLQQRLFNNMRTVVATSATLSIDGSFDFIGSRIGLRDATAMDVGSPFDHEASTLLYLADDMPFPSDGSSYQHALNESIIGLCRATNGRAMVLFTSYASMRSTYEVIKPALAESNVAVYAQNIDAGAKALIDRLKATERSVILGTASFWEGVDVPGDALSALVITKLPFPVPSDPVFQARAELLENDFMELSVPKAVLKFKQGFGRLIRRTTDRGVVAVLDRRVIAKRYGTHFLQSLPPTTQRIGSRRDLPDFASRWLSGERLPEMPEYFADEFDPYEGVWQ